MKPLLVCLNTISSKLYGAYVTLSLTIYSPFFIFYFVYDYILYFCRACMCVKSIHRKRIFHNQSFISVCAKFQTQHLMPLFYNGIPLSFKKNGFKVSQIQLEILHTITITLCHCYRLNEDID